MVPASPSATHAVQNGDIVSILYTGTLDDGEVFDTNREEGGELLQFEVGAGEVIPGFDAAVVGMKKGESKKFRLEAKDAYGEFDDELVQKVPREEFGEHAVEPEMVVDLEDEDGNTFTATILEVDEEGVTLDLNHELAGEALTFEITLVDVRKA
ncbi:MAG TPA: peptidylprolyl isomerase [Candidatus Thermoplasmatota archaeon]|nr:peptidylprolyl isomerase [Candidatus Thermoplasmatota archaeon]